MTSLFTVNLLPVDTKDLIDSLLTPASKAARLLDHVIKPPVQAGVGGPFHDLINVMEGSEYSYVKELAKMIRCRLRKQPD